MTEGSPREPLHHRIQADLERQILNGTWPPGSQVPFEQELARRYGCSRMTVNKVMTRLSAAGLIERRRKAGSFVRRPTAQSAVLEIADIRHEVERLGLAYAFEVSAPERRPATAAEAGRLGMAGPVLDLVCQHFAAGQPFCREERVINLLAVPEAAAADFSAISPGAWLMARVPWTAAEHTIRAVAADAGTSAALAIAPGSACLEVERRTWHAGVAVTAVRLTYPGSGHALVARFTPSRA